jgi:hypothetical protein
VSWGTVVSAAFRLRFRPVDLLLEARGVTIGLGEKLIGQHRIDREEHIALLRCSFKPAESLFPLVQSKQDPADCARRHVLTLIGAHP